MGGMAEAAKGLDDLEGTPVDAEAEYTDEDKLPGLTFRDLLESVGEAKEKRCISSEIGFEGAVSNGEKSVRGWEKSLGSLSLVVGSELSAEEFGGPETNEEEVCSVWGASFDFSLENSKSLIESAGETFVSVWEPPNGEKFVFGEGDLEEEPPNGEKFVFGGLALLPP